MDNLSQKISIFECENWLFINDKVFFFAGKFIYVMSHHLILLGEGF